MNDLRKYSREFITEFIHLYKCLPAVWKVKSKEYSNRDMKSQAYDVLVEKWKEVEPRADRDFVVKKINSIRTVYRRELKKIGNEYWGTSTEELPSPSLWYFHLLDFLRDQEILKPLTSNSEQENTQNTTPIQYLKSECPSPGQSSNETPESPIPPPAPSSSKRRRAKKRLNVSDPEISNQLEEPSPKLDRFDYVGKIWAETLRSLPNEQRIYAEKIINDVLFEAQLNALTHEDIVKWKPGSEHFIEINLSERK